jgi:hypothetical protein
MISFFLSLADFQTDVDEALKLGDEMLMEVEQALSQMQKSVTSEFLTILNRLKGTESKKAAELIVSDFKILVDTLENDFKNLNEQCTKMFASQSGGVGELVLDYHSKVRLLPVEFRFIRIDVRSDGN